jgi:CCR4-NOT complex subunit CAF16
MLAIAEHWLRKELEEAREQGKFERAQLDHMECDPTDRQGGYASGRNIPLEAITGSQTRQGRLSDMMGNAGVLAKHHN